MTPRELEARQILGTVALAFPDLREYQCDPAHCNHSDSIILGAPGFLRVCFSLDDLRSRMSGLDVSLPPTPARMQNLRSYFLGASTAPAEPEIKELYILRGAPGAGKSCIATALSDSASLSAVVCSADTFFERDGTYQFQHELLPQAHAACLRKATEAFQAGVNRVILDNCNILVEHFRPYEILAAKHGYKVIHLVIERRHNGVNSHGVPAETVRERAYRLWRSLRL